MSDLRARLLALAYEYADNGSNPRQMLFLIAVDAARMALTDAASLAETWGGLPPSPQGRRGSASTRLRRRDSGSLSMTSA